MSSLVYTLGQFDCVGSGMCMPGLSCLLMYEVTLKFNLNIASMVTSLEKTLLASGF